MHVDITKVFTENDEWQKVAFVKDNFSKAILHYKTTSNKADSHFIKNLFQETVEKYDLLNTTNPINILSDGGPENKGVFLDWVNQLGAPPAVLKITASTEECPFSNSMAESTHSLYKTEFLRGKNAFDEIDHIKNLKQFVEYYNYQRYPSDHFGLTTLEVLHGKIPDKHFFQQQIAEAKQKRIEENRTFNQCSINSLCL